MSTVDSEFEMQLRALLPRAQEEQEQVREQGQEAGPSRQGGGAAGPRARTNRLPRQPYVSTWDPAIFPPQLPTGLATEQPYRASDPLCAGSTCLFDTALDGFRLQHVGQPQMGGAFGPGGGGSTLGESAGYMGMDVRMQR